MRKSQVKVGGRYTAKVSEKVVTVRVLRERTYPASGWECVNESTGRKIDVRSSQRFRSEVV